MIKEFTTEALRTQRREIFPWPRDDGQGKEPPAFGGSSNSTPRTTEARIVERRTLPGGLHSFARSPSPDRAKKQYALCSLCLRG
ncbi:MAG: hypothetical protein P8X67_02800 [Syntrophobacterales bacterium]